MADYDIVKSGTGTSYTSQLQTIRAEPDLSLARALADLREVAAEAAKAAEDYLTARDRWYEVRDRLSDLQSKIAALREQHDR